MPESILDRLNVLFRDIFDDDSLQVSPATTASDVDGWDSLAHIRLMLNVERAFKVKLTASEIGKLKSVGDLVSLVERKTAAV